MAITYGYFNSLNGDRVYNADQMSEYFDGLVSNGVYESIGGALRVSSASGMTVNVATGRAIIACKWIKNDAILPLTVTAAHATLARYSAVVVRLDNTNRLMTITTKDGTPASTPTKPAMADTETIKELCLAYIYVRAGATALTQADIQDTRGLDICGFVTGLIEQVDTNNLWAQYQSAFAAYYTEMTAQFTSWFDTLTSQLNVNTYIRRFEMHVTLSGAGSVTINPEGYSFDREDVILVFINGLYGSRGTDYTMDTSGTLPVVTPVTTAAGTVLDIVVLKTRIGFYTLADSDNNAVETSGGLIVRA